MTWHDVLLHGLAGVGLIALLLVHVYFGLRPEKTPITKSMIFGWMGRDSISRNMIRGAGLRRFPVHRRQPKGVDHKLKRCR